jgi:subfamily B ATP-binding cassette protein MsbA
MRDYLTKVLELTKPYRVRLVLGLFCGFLSGALAFSLPVSLKLAVDTVFPLEQANGAGTPRPRVAPDQGERGRDVPAPQVESDQAPADAPGIGATAAQTSGKSALTSRLPAPLKRTLDGLVEWFRPSEHPSRFRIVLVISLIPAAMLIRGVLTYMNAYFLSWVGIRAANDLRKRLFKHLMELPLGFFSRTSTGDLMQRIEGALAVNSTIKDSFGVIIREPITIIVLICTLIAMQPFLSVFALLVFPICLVPVIVFGRKFRKSHSGVHTKFANLAKVMHESFTGIRVIKGYNLEPMMVNEFRQATDGVTGFFMRSVRAGELPGPLIEFIGSIGVALVFCYFAFVSAERAPAGDMFAFFIAVFGLYAPLKNLSRLNHQLTLARVGVDPVYQLLNIQSTLPEPAQPKALKAQDSAIRFENVSFSYGDKTVLHDINLTIKPGQFVALVGRTGSGKTSIANLLLRFYDPHKGAVLIGDTDIRAVSSSNLRANIALVTQQTILFNDTIRNNIALGRPGATNQEIEEAARHAYAHGFIMDRPHKYESLVGEKGVNLSGGQQQRISIARAILKDAPILILDEATNALDPEAEQIVQTALEELMQRRTTICIAHRLSTIQKADLIVVLDGGRIVETGTHEELLKARGVYSKLYELHLETAAAL